jgi:arylsulfatase A-like enzyme
VGVSHARPNLLVLMADQFRSDLLGVNGSTSCRTPTLDRLAEEGVSFTRAYTTCPLCTPARGALFTGRYPHRNGLTANVQYPETPTPRLPEGERLLFEYLATGGYRCGYVGKWHLNYGDESQEAHRRGVADFFAGRQAASLHRQRLRLPAREDVGRGRERTMAGEHPPMSGVAPYPEAYHLDAGIAGQAVEVLRGYTREGVGTGARPFALVCSFHGPHFPIEVPEPWASLYQPQDVPRPASFDDTFACKPPGQRTHPWLQLASHLSWPEWQRVIAHYWGFATYVDAMMGRVLDALDETGLTGRTVVLATADHGEMAGHHRMFDKGPYLYEDVMRVPFVWRVPGASRGGAGHTDGRLVSHVDVVPTLLELTGVRPAAGSPRLHGRNLTGEVGAPVLRRPAAGPPHVAHQPVAVFGETNAGDRVNPQLDTRMVIAGAHKYVFRPGDVDELYDLDDDPEELRNVAHDATYRGVRHELESRLKLWMAETEDRLAWR